MPYSEHSEWALFAVDSDGKGMLVDSTEIFAREVNGNTGPQLDDLFWFEHQE